ncbi:hypothetical protein CFAM422_008881 [Trichoderma lentiforme]|uniref:Uncharacterized protein n=1 Tax=Trichoderma lentiforme TaxID=1567552 RepID=A0A9P5CC16_9HYPO|nr:hypothetical protein CFAM422_008881 [Trichoderma lentiforme]
MLPDHFWPIIFFLCLLMSIGILACLTYTVFSIIFERNATREDSPPERYYTFERSVTGPFEDEAPRRKASMFGIPQKFLRRSDDTPTIRTKRQPLPNQVGGSSRDDGRRRSKPLKTPARRVLFNAQQGSSVRNRGFSEHESTPRTLLGTGSQAPDHRDGLSSISSSLVVHAPVKGRTKRDKGKENERQPGREDFLFNMSV